LQFCTGKRKKTEKKAKGVLHLKKMKHKIFTHGNEFHLEKTETLLILRISSFTIRPKTLLIQVDGNKPIVSPYTIYTNNVMPIEMSRDETIL